MIYVEDYSSHHGSVEIELSLCYSKHSFFFQPTKSEVFWLFFGAGNGEHGSLPKTRKKTPLPFSTQRDFVLRKVSFVQRAFFCFFFFSFFLKSRVFFFSVWTTFKEKSTSILVYNQVRAPSAFCVMVMYYPRKTTWPKGISSPLSVRCGFFSSGLFLCAKNGSWESMGTSSMPPSHPRGFIKGV